MSTKVEITKLIRFSISQLGAENGASKFEDICRHFATKRICKNILAATGPVQAGGDQGRDFETFYTYIVENTINGSNSATLTNKKISFACSLEKNPTKKNGKILKDVNSIINQGEKPDRIYFFSGEDIPIAKRHDIIKQVQEQFNIPIEIIDANSLSEQLADEELFWIAYKYLNIPNYYNIEEVSIGSIDKLPQKPPRKSYSFNKTYIKRFITDRIYNNSDWNSYYDSALSPQNLVNHTIINEPENYEDTLIEQIQKGEQKRIVLLSTAGYGKSTELEFIAHYFSKPASTFFPIKISLNNILSENIEEFISIENNAWLEIQEEQRLIILDGLDEINSNHIYEVFSKIEKFGIKYPKTQIIVSCRNNFYTAGTNEEDGSIKGFKSYYLQDVSLYYLIKYVKEELINDYETFFEEITSKKKGDLLKNPFYLIHLVEYYKSKNTLPNTSSDIIHLILELKIENDKKHFERKINGFEFKQSAIFKLAEKIAVYNQSLGKNYIDENELLRLEKDTDLLYILKHSFIIKKDPEYPKRRQFEHNNFQEYLAAKFLSKLELKEIKAFIAFEPDFKKIKPYWLNTFTHLFNLLARNPSKFQPLLDWLIEVEPKALIQLEIEKIDIEIREKIFINLLNNSITKYLSLYGEDFSFEELMRFSGGSEKIIFFLLEKTKTAKLRKNLIDCIELLSNITNPSDYEEELIDLFKEILEKESHYNVVSRSLKAIKKLELYNNTEFINNLVDEYSVSNSSHKRSGLFELILNATNTEELTLQFIKLAQTPLKRRKIHINKPSEEVLEQEPYIHDENEKLNKCFRKITTKVGLLELVAYFTKNRLLFTFNKTDKTPEIIIGNLITIGKDKEIFEAVLDLFKLIARGPQNRSITLLTSYFTKTNSINDAFKILLNDETHSKNGVWTASYLINKETIDFVINKYKSNSLSKDTIITLRSGISLYNKEMFEYFYSAINLASNNNFLYPAHKDYEKEQIERIKKDISLLFNKELFTRKVNEYFAEYGIEINKDKLDEIKALKQNNDEFNEDIVLRKLYEMADDHYFVTKELTNTELLNDNSWLWFKLGKLLEYLNDGYRSSLLNKHIEWIKTWCRKNIESADFNTAVDYSENGTYSYRFKEWYLFQFFFILELEYPKQKMIDMLNYDLFNDFCNGEINKESNLFKRLSEGEVKQQVISYFKNEQRNIHLLNGHIKLIEEYALVDAQYFLINVIKKDTIDEWTKQIALKTYLKLNGTEKNLILLVDYLNFKDHWNWILLETLSKIKSVKALKKLKDTTILTDENWIHISKALLQFEDKLGLEIIHNRLLVRKSIKYEYSLPVEYIVKLNFNDAFEYLFNMLKFVYTTEYKFTKFYSIEGDIFRCLDSFINNNDALYTGISKKINDDILPEIKDIEKIGSINYYLQMQEKSYYTNKKDFIDEDELIRKINAI